MSGQVNASAGDDTITGGELLDYMHIDSGDGDDRLHFTAGAIQNSVIYTGNGNDYFYLAGDLLNSMLDTGSGNDTINIAGGGGESTIMSGTGNDSMAVGGRRTNWG
ncbi:MAG: hypothetical protein ACNI3A_08145 [Desulfovibrio sp.]|uniref:hypothetical protein n=1 Tax=Desulfovibrio sp. 7SRBS1 TaxID=3378064 RepID=UPI003B3D8A3B